MRIAVEKFKRNFQCSIIKGITPEKWCKSLEKEINVIVNNKFKYAHDTATSTSKNEYEQQFWG